MRSGTEVRNAGVRLAIPGEERQVLAADFGDGDGFNLLGGPVLDGEGIEDTAIRLLKEFLGLESGSITEAHQGTGDKYRPCSAFAIETDEEPNLGILDARVAYVSAGDVMRGRWGLFARDVLNGAGLIRRPKLELDELYRISQVALDNGSNRATEGVDLVIDEVSLLQDIGKPHAVDRFIRDVDVGMLHPDIADAMLVAVEGIEGLPSLGEFRRQVELRMEETGTLIRKIVMKDSFGKVLSEDVRGDARKLYRKKAREFSEQRRAGTLAQGGVGGGRHRGGAPIRKDIPPEWEKPPDDETLH